jgi:hypothetical protein
MGKLLKAFDMRGTAEDHPNRDHPYFDRIGRLYHNSSLSVSAMFRVMARISLIAIMQPRAS